MIVQRLSIALRAGLQAQLLSAAYRPAPWAWPWAWAQRSRRYQHRRCSAAVSWMANHAHSSPAGSRQRHRDCDCGLGWPGPGAPPASPPACRPGARCGTSASPRIPDQWSRLRSLARHYNGLDRKINTTERPTEPATVSGPATATAAPPSTSRCRRAFVTLPVLPSVIVLIAPRFPPVASLRSPFALLCEVDHGHNPHGRLRTLRLAGHSPLDKVD